MPTFSFSLSHFKKYIPKELSLDEIANLLEYCKCEIKEIKNDEIIVEVTPDRVDHFSIEGLIRSIRGLLGIEKGLVKIDTFNANIKIHIDEKLKSLRPYIMLVIVRDVSLDTYALTSLINLQELLHETIGRNRLKASIGLYDLSKIKGDIYYKLQKLEEIKFKPLGFDYEMNGYEILKKTDKGIKYSHLVGKDSAPILIDSDGNYLSMPPIINSEDTKVTIKTKDILIDSTGFDLNFLSKIISVIMYAVYFYGKKVGLIEHLYPNGTLIPEFKLRKYNISYEQFKKILGFELEPAKILEFLLRSRYNAEFHNNEFIVEIPPYRLDVLHPIDIIEDVAIMYGYSNIPAIYPSLYTRGKLMKKSIINNKIRDIMNGFGFQEILNYMLSSKEIQIHKVNLKEEDLGLITIQNPISKEYDCIRVNLFPGILNFLSYNVLRKYPQKVYELGDVCYFRENKIITERRLCATIINSEINFEELHAYLFSLIEMLGYNIKLKEAEYPFLLKGRCADIFINETKVGWIGEINPEVILNFKLSLPIIAFEINLSKFLEI
jgi:phenylalanyl-tRNA synthetase beta chain